MARNAVFVVVIALAGCTFSSKLNGSSLGSSQPGASSGSASLTVPDLTGKTAAEAEATLRAAGFTFEHATLDDQLCSNDDDTKMVAPETICYQHPAAGYQSGPRLIGMTFTIEHDTYEHGGVGGPSEWRRMPDLVGKPIDVARTILARASLPLADQFELAEDNSDACQPDQVCGTEPEPKARKVLGRKGRLYVGKARPATPATPAKPATDTYF